MEADTSNFRGYDYGEWRGETKFVEQLVNFYCQCLFTHHDDEAVGVLSWLKDEVDTADIRIFHECILPFLAKLHGRMQPYEFSVSEMQQEACQHMVLVFLNRCVGMEPAKSTTWTRPTHHCPDEACLLCPRLDEFLKDPVKEIVYLEDNRPSWGIGHLHSQLYVHECTPNHEMEDARKMLKIKKLDEEWVEAHKAWELRCDKVATSLEHGLATSRPLLGERYEELVKMRPTKICT